MAHLKNEEILKKRLFYDLREHSSSRFLTTTSCDSICKFGNYHKILENVGFENYVLKEKRDAHGSGAEA